jgi:hypothetical protein
MKLRHLLLLAVLAAIPASLAVVLIGSEKSGNGIVHVAIPGLSSPPQVTVGLQGARGATTASACGVIHHFNLYAASGSVPFKGTVSARGQWTVTVKLKACYGGTFRAAGSAQAAVNRAGRFSGSFPTPIGGYYYARAELKYNGNEISRSTKHYFATS